VARACARRAVRSGSRSNLILRGRRGGATGWLGRARRIVERQERDCVERGYLLLAVMFEHEAAGDLDAAAGVAAEAVASGERFGDTDLLALAAQDQGILLIELGRVVEGLALLDEAMVAVTAGELSPIVNGFVYCGVITGCQAAYEPRRAQEWTEALTTWCEQQPHPPRSGVRRRADQRRPDDPDRQLAARGVRGQPRGREGNCLAALELAPQFAERVRGATRETRFVGTADLPNFFRQPSGPGWALVGDAVTSRTRSPRRGSATPFATPRRWPTPSTMRLPGGFRSARRWPAISARETSRRCRSSS
jgi:hypothetical protein